MTHHGAPCWYELYTSDIDAAQDFYNRIMGWQIADSGTPGMDYRLAKAGDTMVAGMMQSDGQPTAWTIYFAVDDADATFAQAIARGAKELVPPSDIPNTGRFALMTDPYGAAFGILQPLPMEDGSTGGGAFDQARMGTGNWNEVITTDPLGAMEFYSALFGWTISRSMPMGAMTYHVIAHNGVDIGGAFAFPGAPMHWKPYFGVPSAKSSMETVTAAGGTVIRGPDEVPGGAWTIQINDPQGAPLALVGPL